jgi:hypothetical protein
VQHILIHLTIIRYIKIVGDIAALLYIVVAHVNSLSQFYGLYLNLKHNFIYTECVCKLALFYVNIVKCSENQRHKHISVVTSLQSYPR